MQEMYPTTEDDTQLIRFHTDQSYLVASNKDIPEALLRTNIHQGRLRFNQDTTTNLSDLRESQASDPIAKLAIHLRVLIREQESLV
jgi:hypothetical protein